VAGRLTTGPAPGTGATGRQGGAVLRHLLEAAARAPPFITTSEVRETKRGEKKMPVAYVDIPTGVNDGAKKKIFQELYEEIHEAWPIPDTRVLIREWPNEAVSQDGRIENVPMRPICTLAVPPGLEHDAKQKLVRQISNTIGEACGREVEEIHLPSGTKIYNNWVLTFFWELPLDKVALGDLIATENPLVLENLPPQ
jgi:phenylpyruvate tautomerase PptA (4-oxalocrotonate tautomerase family)